MWVMAPAMLWWLLAAAAPLALFLLRRRRLRIVPFPPAQLLAEAALVRSRLLRLLEIVLLSLRILLVAVAALVLAEVVVEPRGVFARFIRADRMQVAIVLDDTPSMQRPSADAADSLYEAALARAEALKASGLTHEVHRLSGLPPNAPHAYAQPRPLAELLADAGTDLPAPQARLPAIDAEAIRTRTGQAGSVVVIFTDGAIEPAAFFPMAASIRRLILAPMAVKQPVTDTGIVTLATDEPFPRKGAPVGLRVQIEATSTARLMLRLCEQVEKGVWQDRDSVPVTATAGKMEAAMSVPAATASPAHYRLTIEAEADDYAFNNSLEFALNRFDARLVGLVAADADIETARRLLAPSGQRALDGAILVRVPVAEAGAQLLGARAPDAERYPAAGRGEPTTTVVFGDAAGSWWPAYCADGGSVLFWTVSLPAGIAGVLSEPVDAEIHTPGGVTYGTARARLAADASGAEALLLARTRDAVLPCALLYGAGAGRLTWCGLDAGALENKPWAPAAVSALLDALETGPHGLLIAEAGASLQLPASAAHAAVVNEAGETVATALAGTLHVPQAQPGIYRLAGAGARQERLALAVLPARSERFPAHDAPAAVERLAVVFRDALGVPVSVVREPAELRKVLIAAAGMRSLSGPLALLFLLLFVAEAMLANRLARSRMLSDAPGAERLAV